MSILADVALTIALGYLWFLSSVTRPPECRSDRCDRANPADERPLIYKP
ncbi:hypothetical protein [Oscillatoria acuminata]|nr:hypothetical protein [Oscillatoria acuminata]